jgi:lysophospholipase
LVKHGARTAATDVELKTPLHSAASNGAVRAVRVLLELGADMNCADILEHTPAYDAAYSGYVDSMREFLEAGLDLSFQGTWDGAMLYAATIGGKKMLKYLLDAGGAGIINVQDPGRNTLLYWVV